MPFSFFNIFKVNFGAVVPLSSLLIFTPLQFMRVLALIQGRYSIMCCNVNACTKIGARRKFGGY